MSLSANEYANVSNWAKPFFKLGDDGRYYSKDRCYLWTAEGRKYREDGVRLDSLFSFYADTDEEALSFVTEHMNEILSSKHSAENLEYMPYEVWSEGQLIAEGIVHNSKRVILQEVYR